MEPVSAHAPMPAGLPPDVADQATEFVGRGWALERICNWLSTGRGRLIVVTAEPGAGKTALASRLVQMARGEVGIPAVARVPVLHAAHFCRWGYIESIAPVQVLELMSAQLAGSIPGYAEALALAGSGGSVKIILGRQSVGRICKGASVTMTQIGQVTIAERNPRYAFDLVLRRPLRALRDGGQLRHDVVVLIDGLDESAEGAPEPTLVSLLSAELGNPVPGLRLVLTTRPERIIPRLARYVDEQFDLTADQPPGVGDLKVYTDYKLRAIPKGARLPLAARIARASEGSFLYAHHVITEILTSKSPPPTGSDLKLPDSLSAVYWHFLDREIGADRNAWSQRFRPVLGVLVQARGDGLTRDQLVAITGLPSSAVDDTLSVCAPYLAGEPATGLRLYHHSLRDYLRGPGRHHVYPAEASWKIVTGLIPMRDGAMRWDLAGHYMLRHGPEFAADAGQADQVLVDPEFLTYADPATLMPLLDQARDEAAVLAASVYKDSSDWHQYLEPRARRRALAIDAAKYGAHDLAARLAQPLPWSPIWTLGAVVGEFSPGKGFYVGYNNPGSRALQIVRLSNRRVLLEHNPLRRTGALQMWELATGRPISEPFADRVTAVATTQLRGRVVAVSGGYDGILVVWDLATTQPLEPPLQGSGEVTAVSCVPTGRLALAVSAHESVAEEVVWDSTTGQLTETLPGDELWEDRVVAGSYHSDTESWSYTSSDPSQLQRVTRLSRDWTLRVWDLAVGREVGDPIPMAGGPVHALACTRLGGRAVAVTGSDDGTLRTWDLATGREAGDPIPMAGGPVHALACTRLGGRAVAVTGSDDGTLRIFDLATRRQAGAPLDSGSTMTYDETGNHPVAAGPVYEVACAQLNGRPVAVAGSHDGMVRVWDLISGELLDTIPLWRTMIVALAAAPTGDLAAGTAIAVTVLRWKREGRKLV
jgi:hypothetical protein